MIEKKYFILASIIALLIILTFFLVRPTKEKPIDKTICDRLAASQSKDICHILLSGDPTLCSKVSEGYSTVCYEIVLNPSTVSENLCNSLSDDYGKNLCFRNLAIKLKNPEFCMDNDDCYLDLAQITRSSVSCEKFPSDSSIMLECLALAQGDRKNCDAIQDDVERKSCMGLLPVSLDDCLFFGYYNYDCIKKLAYQKKDISICEKIDKEKLKFDCILNVRNDLMVCDTANDVAKDFCLLYYLRNAMRG